MRPALHSQSVPQYTPAPAYPAFPTSLHHVDSAHDRNLSSYGSSSPGGQQTPRSQHEHVEQHSLPPDTSQGRPIGPQLLSAVQQHHDFSSLASSSVAKAPEPPKYPPPPPPIIPNSGPPGTFDMMPPPASSHSSWQALHDYAQTHASAHGYALSINTTSKNRSRIKLACCCYGKPKNTHKLTDETRQRRNRVSAKTGCRMWIEAKKQEEGVWTLRLGSGEHNHPGRPMDGWSIQRKRTWGPHGGRVGIGGVTAQLEIEKLNSIADGGRSSNANNAAQDEDGELLSPSRKAAHGLENGGVIWKIVEQEMLRRGTGAPGEGRDRGVGRTVKILEERLPGIHIFKRDVYNIRAQIKRARKAAGQEIGEGLSDSGDDEDPGAETPNASSTRPGQLPGSGPNNRIDPTLHAFPKQVESEVDRLRREVTELRHKSEVERLKRELAEARHALSQRAKEIEEKNSEIQSLRVQVELANMALYNERGGQYSERSGH